MANFATDLSLVDVVSASNVSVNTITGGLITTTTGAGVDTIGQVSASLNALLVTGTVSGTTPTLDAKVQDSADNSTFADVTGATFTQVTASNKAQMIYVPPCRRYVRIVATIAGTTPVFNTMGMFLFPNHTSPAAFGGFNQTSAAGNG